MNTFSTSMIGAIGLTLIALTGGCVAGADTGAPEDLADAPALTPNDAKVTIQTGALEVRLERAGNPKWKPVDFHQFSTYWWKYKSVMTTLLPQPEHVWHPVLSIGPGAAHEGPYDSEIADGMVRAGLTDQSSFTQTEFQRGLYLTHMNIPRNDGAPKGSSPDFEKGAIIPNTVFPIHVEIRVLRDGVLDPYIGAYNVPALDGGINPPFDVEGHSHFPMYYVDGGQWYAAPTAGSYRWIITMTDAEGEGWNIQVPYTVH